MLLQQTKTGTKPCAKPPAKRAQRDTNSCNLLNKWPRKLKEPTQRFKQVCNNLPNTINRAYSNKQPSLGGSWPKSAYGRTSETNLYSSKWPNWQSSATFLQRPHLQCQAWMILDELPRKRLSK